MYIGNVFSLFFDKFLIFENFDQKRKNKTKQNKQTKNKTKQNKNKTKQNIFGPKFQIWTFLAHKTEIWPKSVFFFFVLVFFLFCFSFVFVFFFGFFGQSFQK